METLAPDDDVVILLEMQQQIVNANATLPAQALNHAASVLFDTATQLSIPVLCPVWQVDAESPKLIGELDGKAPAMSRTTISAFDDPAVRDVILASNRKTIAIGGVSSEIAVLHTAIDARRRGFDVHLLVDCCGGLSARTEAAAWRRLEANGVVPTNISSFLTAMFVDKTSAEGQIVLPALARLWKWNVDS